MIVISFAKFFKRVPQRVLFANAANKIVPNPK